MYDNSLVIIKGIHKVDKLVEIGQKLYCKTDQGLFKVKEVIMGTTIIANYHQENTIEQKDYKFIKKYIELHPISSTEILQSFEESSLTDIKYLENNFTEDFIRENLLYKDAKGVAKFSINEMINLLIYRQSGIISGNQIENEDLRLFLMSTCNDNYLLGVLLLLKNIENLYLGYEEWKEKNLMEFDIVELRKSVKKCKWVKKEEKLKIEEFLKSKE
ncbi:hypothetical protein NUSPORA_01319 [Nucleospora cyclopteri]